MSAESLGIPEGLVFMPERWKVLSITSAIISKDRNGRYTHKEEPMALIMPSEPGGGGLFSGFDMRLAQIKAGKIDKRGYGVGLTALGQYGFCVALTHYPGNIFIDQEAELSWYYKTGFRKKIEDLRSTLDIRREVLTNPLPNQAEWEVEALEISPVLARFLDFSSLKPVD